MELQQEMRLRNELRRGPSTRLHLHHPPKTFAAAGGPSSAAQSAAQSPGLTHWTPHSALSPTHHPCGGSEVTRWNEVWLELQFHACTKSELSLSVQP